MKTQTQFLPDRLPAALIAAAAAILAPAAHADNVHGIGADDQRSTNTSLREAAIESFQETAPEGLDDAVPHFAIFGRQGKFYLGIGGSVKVTVGEDWGAPLENPNNFTTSEITPAQPGSKERFHLSAQQSSLFVDFVAFPNDKNRISAYIGLNLLNNYVPVVQNAYVKWRGFKAGYDYTAFSDNAALPPTIDYEGPCGATPITVPTFTYTHSFGKADCLSATVGIELPQYSVTTGRETSTVTQSVPDVPISLRYRWNGGDDWVKLSAIARNLMYRDVAAARNVDILGWGVELSGTAAILPQLRGFWTAVYGRGVASYIQDLSGLGLDLTPSGDGATMKASPTWGGYAGLQYNFTDNVYASATYSHVRNYARSWSDRASETPFGDTYRYAQYAVANLFWDINSYISTGVEYIYGRRVNCDGTQAHCNRIQTMIQVSF